MRYNEKIIFIKFIEEYKGIRLINRRCLRYKMKEIDYYIVFNSKRRFQKTKVYKGYDKKDHNWIVYDMNIINKMDLKMEYIIKDTIRFQKTYCKYKGDLKKVKDKVKEYKIEVYNYNNKKELNKKEFIKEVKRRRYMNWKEITSVFYNYGIDIDIFWKTIKKIKGKKDIVRVDNEKLINPN